ncbi:uncharacterized protein V2V93DRAFT_377054 [Kockiozyma suomiensis]|uniref:uncharacterized protein n=1 Tax=Kockiozyma suomiensis TaxID=1337062 RepID=UPI003343C33C
MSLVTEASSTFSAEPSDHGFFSESWYHRDEDCDRGESCLYATYSDDSGKTYNYSVISSAETLQSKFWRNNRPHSRLNTTVYILVATAAMIMVIRSFRRGRSRSRSRRAAIFAMFKRQPTSLDSASEGQLPQDLIRPRPRFLYRIALNSILRFLGILSKCGYFCGVAMLAVVVVIEMKTGQEPDKHFVAKAETKYFGFGFAMSIFEALLEEYIFGRYGVI